MSYITKAFINNGPSVQVGVLQILSTLY